MTGRRWISTILGWLGLMLILVSCGGQGGSSTPQQASGGATSGVGVSPSSSTPAPSASVSPSPSSSPLTPGQQLFGKVTLMSLQFMRTADDQAAAVASLSQLQSLGMNATAKGEVVIWPQVAAAGWQARVGTQLVILGSDGSFSIKVPSDGTAQGTLTHPTDSAYTTSFSLSSLGTAPNQKTLVIPVPFDPCGMSEGDVCAPPPTPQKTTEAPRAAAPISVTTGPLGTYPSGNTYICPQKDGYFSSGSTEVRYLGSTCDKNVIDGACPNENYFSDIEYNSLRIAAGDAGAGLARLLGVGSEFLTPPFKPHDTGLIHCVDNHKGRVCGMFLLGDIALDIGKVLKAGDRGTLLVAPGARGTITVHNNGVFGITQIHTDDFATGIVVNASTLTFLSNDGNAVDMRLDHFDPDPAPDVSHKKFVYTPDRALTYIVPQAAKPGDRATYAFSADGRTVTVVFQVNDLDHLQPASSTTTVGSTVTLTGADKDGNVIPATSLTWKTSDASVATVVNGVVSGVGPGKVTITATVASSGTSATAQVVVLPAIAGTWSGTYTAVTDVSSGCTFTANGSETWTISGVTATGFSVAVSGNGASFRIADCTNLGAFPYTTSIGASYTTAASTISFSGTVSGPFGGNCTGTIQGSSMSVTYTGLKATDGSPTRPITFTLTHQ